jgi:hypothetical protein
MKYYENLSIEEAVGCAAAGLLAALNIAETMPS